MSSRWHTVTVDATDPARLGRWWAEVLDYRIIREAPDAVVVAQAAESRPSLVFMPARLGVSGRNGLHINLEPEEQAAEVERLVNMGARHVDLGQAGDAPWVVLADPEGNEFRVLRAQAG